MDRIRVLLIIIVSKIDYYNFFYISDWMSSFITKLSNKFKTGKKKADQAVIRQSDFVAKSTYAQTASKPNDMKPPQHNAANSTVKRPPLHQEAP